MHSANIVLLGASGSGKSTLLDRYLGKEFSTVHDKTTSSRTFIQFAEINDYDVLLTLLDTPCGSADKDSLLISVDCSHMAVVVFSVTDSNSFEVAKELVQLVKNRPVLLVGNKIDLEEDRVVSYDSAVELGVKYMELTARRDSDIDLLFETIGSELMASRLSAQSWFQWWSGGSCVRCRFCRHCGFCDCCPWSCGS